MITSTGRIKLLDLGTVSTSSPRPRPLAEGALGAVPAPLALPMTAAYAAPELLRAGKSTPQADIYSIGLILHELVTGRRYLGAKRDVEAKSDLPSAGPIAAFDRGEYEPSAETPPWLRARLAEMLHADPALRPVTAGALAETLSDDVCREDPAMLQEEKRVQALGALGFQFRSYRGIDRIWPFREHRLQSVSVGERQAPTAIPLDAPGVTRHLVSDLEMTVEFAMQPASGGRPQPLAIPSGDLGAALDLNAYATKTSVELQLTPGQPGRIYLSERGPSQLKLEWLVTTQGSFYVGERGRRTKLHCQYQPLKAGRAITVASLRASFAVADARIGHLLTLHTDPTEYAVNVYCIGVY